MNFSKTLSMVLSMISSMLFPVILLVNLATTLATKYSIHFAMQLLTRRTARFLDAPGKPAPRHRMRRSLLWLTTSLTLLSGAVQADTLANANALFAYAEANFSDLLRPANPETQTVQGFYVRHYTETEIYLGVRGDNI